MYLINGKLEARRAAPVAPDLGLQLGYVLD